MGTIKIELDVPEFQNSLVIGISLTKDNDGTINVVKPSNPFVTVTNNNGPVSSPASVANNNPFVTAVPEEVKPVTTRKKSSGNMMNSDLF